MSLALCFVRDRDERIKISTRREEKEVDSSRGDYSKLRKCRNTQHFNCTTLEDSEKMHSNEYQRIKSSKFSVFMELNFSKVKILITKIFKIRKISKSSPSSV